MPREVKLPEISENVESGDVVKVLVHKGDRIAAEQPLVELETEKAAFEVPSPAEGTVADIAVKEGDSVKVGQVLLTLEEGDETDERMDMLLGKKRASDRRAWLEAYGNMADIEV